MQICPKTTETSHGLRQWQTICERQKPSTRWSWFSSADAILEIQVAGSNRAELPQRFGLIGHQDSEKRALFMVPNPTLAYGPDTWRSANKNLGSFSISSVLRYSVDRLICSKRAA